MLVALSGGRDSVALLHLLRTPALGLELHAAHVHHGLRGAEADEDAEFCRRLCVELGLPFELLRLPRENPGSATGEAAWRRGRYQALLEHARQRGLDAVATGHHRDDVAEGVLVQLLRGAGPRAMSGISAETAEGVIRPLLPWSRDDIEAWLTSHRIEWREDSSNRDLVRTRNRVRHEVLPELEKAAPHLRRHLVNLAHAVAEGEEFMAFELRRRARFADPWEPDGGVELATLQDLAPALRTRWLHGQMAGLGVEHTTRRQLELFNQLLDTGAPRAVTLGQRWRLRVAQGKVWAEPPAPPRGCRSTLVEGRWYDIGVPGWMARITTAAAPEPRVRWSWRPTTSGSEVSFRPARGDDRLPDAASGQRRVGKVLADVLPRHLRAAWPLFCENDMIQWIPGVWEHPRPRNPSDRLVEVIRQ